VSTIKVDAIQGTSGTSTAITLSGDVATFSQTPVGTFISEADQFRLTVDITSDTDPISSNLERVDDASFSKIGTGMSVSSGIFSFPSTGLYLVKINAMFRCEEGDFSNVRIKVTTNNSSYDDVAIAEVANIGTASSSNVASVGTTETFVNVTDTSNVKVKFVTNSFNTDTKILGRTDFNETFFTFLKLGESQ
tara:strand:+ start:28 stop:603 length:576 start_codon:yes stop_codon:yes gene_type:complete